MAENKGLILGSEKSCVAVCTLWTQTDRFEEVLLPDEYRLIGNLYSVFGVGILIRNYLANFHISGNSIHRDVRAGFGKSWRSTSLVNEKRRGR